MIRSLRWTMMWAVIFVFGMSCFGIAKLKVEAREPEPASYIRYYKSVYLEEGDSLWNLAKEYGTGSPITVEEYIQEIKEINGLREDTIHRGCYLTVVYFEPTVGHVG